MSTEPAQSDTGLRCPTCGYNLTAVTSSTCPECGERFLLTNTQGYLAKVPLSKLWRLCMALWIVGTVIVVLSWIDVVSPTIGWVGFAIGGIGTLISLKVRR